MKIQSARNGFRLPIAVVNRSGAEPIERSYKLLPVNGLYWRERKIVAHGGDPVQVVAQARARGIKIPYLFYVEAVDEGVVRMGL
jgi:hypothetical protein